MSDIDNPALVAAFERLDAIVAELEGRSGEETPRGVQLFFARFYAAMELLGPTPSDAPIVGHAPRSERAGDEELLAAVLEVVRVGEFALSESRP